MINNPRKHIKRRNFLIILVFALSLWMLGSTQNVDYQTFHNLSSSSTLIRVTSYSLDLLAVISSIFFVLLLLLLFILSFDLHNYKTSFFALFGKTKKLVRTKIFNSSFLFACVVFICAILLSYLINFSVPNALPSTGNSTSTAITNPVIPPSTVTSGVNSTESPLFTSCVAPCTSISFLPYIINLVNSYLILIFIGIFLLLIAVLRLRSSSVKKTPVTPPKTINKYENLDKIRETILAKYLKASKYLEQLGADKRFSLTPQEFEANVKRRLYEIWSKFPRITYFYELARFSDSVISESDLLEFNTLITEFYAEVDQYMQKLASHNEEPRHT